MTAVLPWERDESMMISMAKWDPDHFGIGRGLQLCDGRDFTLVHENTLLTDDVAEKWYYGSTELIFLPFYK